MQFSHTSLPWHQKHLAFAFRNWAINITLQSSHHELVSAWLAWDTTHQLHNQALAPNIIVPFLMLGQNICHHRSNMAESSPYNHVMTTNTCSRQYIQDRGICIIQHAFITYWAHVHARFSCCIASIKIARKVSMSLKQPAKHRASSRHKAKCQVFLLLHNLDTPPIQTENNLYPTWYRLPTMHMANNIAHNVFSIKRTCATQCSKLSPCWRHVVIKQVPWNKASKQWPYLQTDIRHHQTTIVQVLCQWAKSLNRTSIPPQGNGFGVMFNNICSSK